MIAGCVVHCVYFYSDSRHGVAIIHCPAVSAVLLCVLPAEFKNGGPACDESAVVERVVPVGHNMNPDIFCRGRNDDKWVFLTAADTLGGDDGATSKQQLSSFGTARALFNAKVTKGAAAAAAAPGGESLTKHQGAITCVQVYSKGGEGLLSRSIAV